MNLSINGRDRKMNIMIICFEVYNKKNLLTPACIFYDCGEPDALAGVIKYPDGTLITMDSFRETVYGYDIRLEVGTKTYFFMDHDLYNHTFKAQNINEPA